MNRDQYRTVCELDDLINERIGRRVLVTLSAPGEPCRATVAGGDFFYSYGGLLSRLYLVRALITQGDSVELYTCAGCAACGRAPLPGVTGAENGHSESVNRCRP